MEPIDYSNIETKVANLIKANIKEKNLIRTGNMYNSIKVRSSKSGLIISAVDYFVYVDYNNNILNDVFNSEEFISLIANEAGDQIGDFLVTQLE